MQPSRNVYYRLGPEREEPCRPPTPGFATGKPSNAGFCHRKTLQRRVLPPEKPPTPGLCRRKTLQRRGSDCTRIWRQRFWPAVCQPTGQFWYGQSCSTKILCLSHTKMSPKRQDWQGVLVMEALGMDRALFWAGFYEAVAGFCQGFS